MRLEEMIIDGRHSASCWVVSPSLFDSLRGKDTPPPTPQACLVGEDSSVVLWSVDGYLGNRDVTDDPKEGLMWLEMGGTHISQSLIRAQSS